MQAVILQCKPLARFHFGALALDNNAWLSTTSEWLPSDTLFSALVNTFAAFCSEKETERLMNYFLDGHVLLSSGFYLLETGGKKTFFLPKPAHFNLNAPDKEYKKYGAVQLISKTVWEAGWLPADWAKHCVLLQQGKVLAAKSDLPPRPDGQPWQFEDPRAGKIALYQINDYPRVKVHTRTRTDNFYHFTALNISNNEDLLADSLVHMYFLLDRPGKVDENDWKTIEAAIRMLPYMGLGGERAAGCGFFESADFEPFAIKDPGQDWYASVSLTLPATEVELKKACYYQVQTRGGRQFGGADKRFDFVRMMSEGAVSAGKIDGHCYKFRQKNEGHDVYRYGKAFCLPTIKMAEPEFSIQKNANP